jgi:molybdopterin synthase sulfur carrier subunit
MQINLKYFASIRETMGSSGQAYETQAQTLGQLRDELVQAGGLTAQAIGRDRVLRMALNQTLCEEGAALIPGAEVAFFPPVTGG